MKKYTILVTLLIGMIFGLTAKAEKTVIAEGDTLTFTSRYTIAIDNVKLINKNSDFVLHIRNANSRGTTVHIMQEKIWSDTGDTIVSASGLATGNAPHNYVLVRAGISILRFYKDNILLCTLKEKLFTDEAPIVYVDPYNVEDGYSVSLISQTAGTIPDETTVETNLSNMYSGILKNLAEDPYCNHGFLCNGLNSEERTFYSNAATFTGWGNNAVMDSENAFSGPWCVKLFGQAVASNQGASLDQSLTFSTRTPYLIRAMIKSEGYEGKLAISGENKFIHITDTKGEWKQFEGVIVPTASRSVLYLNNADFENNGTVYVDNIEVYAGYYGISNVPAGGGNIAFVQLKATDKWSPTNPVNAYFMGFTDEGISYSQIDTAKVKVMGGTSLTKTVEGSRMYALRFPGDLADMTVTGTVDMKSLKFEPLVNGIDYILQRYDYPRFEFVGEDEAITSGSYIVQFVDNLDNLPVTMNFNSEASGEKQTGDYRFTGNPLFMDYTPAGKFLKFNEDNQRFELAEGETLRPFEAYIESDESLPVNYIYTGYNTKLQRLTADNGERMSVYSVKGGIVINSLGDSNIDLYAITGQKISSLSLTAGSNTISLPKGIYLIGGKKVAVFK